MGAFTQAAQGVGGLVGNVAGGLVGDVTGGLANSSGATDSYTATAPLIDQQNFSSGIAGAQNGLSTNVAGQQSLLQALQAQAAGQGANPAQAMLNQATSNNIAQGTGMIASQKGINPALAQRQAAMQTAAANQTAAGQAATMQANQQMNAQNAQANVYGNIGTEQNTMESTLQNANSAQNTAINQGAIGTDQLNANAAATNADVRGKIDGGLLSGAGAAGGSALGGGAAAAAYTGALVPGKANVAGDSPENDTKAYKLSPGEAVLPRSIMNAKDPGEAAKTFVQHLLMMKQMDSQHEQAKGHIANLLAQKMKAS